jgi:DNA-binding XRE family transcriptional regulator
MAACRFELHHCVPRCLLGFFDRVPSGERDGAGLQAWSDWEEEAFRHGVDPDVSRGELVALIESSAVEIPEEQHKASHSRRRLRPVGPARRSRNAAALRPAMVRPPRAKALGTRRPRDARPLPGTARGKDGGGLTAAPFFLLICLHFVVTSSTLCRRIVVRACKLRSMEVDTERLKELRRRKVLSMRELQELSGVSHNTIWRIESGRQGAHPRTIRKLAKALGVEPEELLREEE